MLTLGQLFPSDSEIVGLIGWTCRKCISGEARSNSAGIRLAVSHGCNYSELSVETVNLHGRVSPWSKRSPAVANK